MTIRICCGTPLFESTTKFDAGCGWPSYWAPIHSEVIERVVDNTHGMVRVEVRCNACGEVFTAQAPDGVIEAIESLEANDLTFTDAVLLATALEYRKHSHLLATIFPRGAVLQCLRPWEALSKGADRKSVV